MLLFKYFEERAKDGLPDANNPLSSRACTLGQKHWPTERYPGECEVASYLLSRQHLKERKVVHTIGK